MGLVHVTESHESANGERGVAQPAEPVVPVERTADMLGQRGGRRRDDRTGGSVDHEPEGERASNHHLSTGTVIAGSSGPVLPPMNGALEGGAGPLAQGRQYRRSLGGEG